MKQKQKSSTNIHDSTQKSQVEDDQEQFRHADDFTSYDNLLAIKRQKKLFRKTALDNKKYLEENAKPLKQADGVFANIHQELNYAKNHLLQIQ